MSYWIARPNPHDSGYYIATAESFSVRSNAEAYIRRRGWGGCLVVTDDQKVMIEGTGQIEAEAQEEESTQERREKRARRGRGVVPD